MSSGFTGGCLCGAIRYKCTSDPVAGGHCHCVACRKSSGTGHGSHIMVNADDFTVTGDAKGYESAADSGNLVTRYFCPTCGSPVYSTNSGMPGLAVPRASSLDDPEVFKPALVVYAKHAPSWDLVDPELPSFQGMPPTESMPDT